MLLRYLKEVKLKKATKTKQNNGTYINVYTDVGTYKVQTQDLTDDQVSATIYGSDITKMIRISSPLKNLENYLLPKVDNLQDNISLYYIEYKSHLYKINSVSINRIELERI